MAEETKQIEYTKTEVKEVHNQNPDSENYGEVEEGTDTSADIYLNPNRDWEVKEGKDWGYYHAPQSFKTNDVSEGIDMLVNAIQELCKQVSQGYKHEGWWKQIVRDGEEVEMMPVYCGDVANTVRMMGTPKKATVSTVGSNKIKIDVEFVESSSRNNLEEVSIYQHMKSHEVKQVKNR